MNLSPQHSCCSWSRPWCLSLRAGFHLRVFPQVARCHQLQIDTVRPASLQGPGKVLGLTPTGSKWLP